MSDYSATEQHMRMNYIAGERRRNKYRDEPQSDEELGEEFDQGMKRIREDAARTVTYTGLKPGVTYYAEVNGGEMVVLEPTMPCPECRAGKHTNCVEWALDSKDQEVPCPCSTGSHK